MNPVTILFCQNCGNIGKGDTPDGVFLVETNKIENWKLTQFFDPEEGTDFDFAFVSEEEIEKKSIRCGVCNHRILEYLVEFDKCVELFEIDNDKSRKERFLEMIEDD